jgi:hypothetical protein
MSLDISPAAQDHVSVSMSMSLLEYGLTSFQTQIDNNTLTPESITDFMDQGEAFETSLSEIKAIVESTQTTDS